MYYVAQNKTICYFSNKKIQVQKSSKFPGMLFLDANPGLSGQNMQLSKCIY